MNKADIKNLSLIHLQLIRLILEMPVLLLKNWD